MLVHIGVNYYYNNEDNVGDEFTDLVNIQMVQPPKISTKNSIYKLNQVGLNHREIQLSLYNICFILLFNELLLFV